MKKYTVEEWQAEGLRLFGPATLDWAFRCPACGHVQTMRHMVMRGMTPEEAERRVYFSCEGRWHESVGCDWTLGGFLQLHKAVIVEPDRESPVFEFATPENAPGPEFKPFGKLRAAR